MPSVKFTNLDFDQIKTSIKDYLRANSNFTDFDFEGSNFSILIDTLAYNTYITAFNSNMIVNESFLDSATVRENVVSLARNIGYVPRSRTCSKAAVIITADLSNVNAENITASLTLRASGPVCIGSANDTTYVFSIPENITTTVSNKIATFGTTNDPIYVYEGTLVKNTFTVNGSVDQRFILNNQNIDTSTLVVRVKGASETGEGQEYDKVDNILNINSESKTYLIQEIQDERYELLFGDGIFGKKLSNGDVITVTYITTNGIDGNGASNFTFSGSFLNSNGTPITATSVSVTTVEPSRNGGEIENIDSIKYFAPRLYSSQYRAVTSRDYESIIQSIYPNTESVSVVGGEELNPPQFGTVQISIKPKNGDYISDFDKGQIISKLKNYSLTGINQKIVDLKVLYVELDSSIYYNSSATMNAEGLRSKVIDTINQYSKSVNLNKFGGRLKYSQLLQLIDNTDVSITSNITKIIIRRNLKSLINQPAQYELCFGNQFHINPEGFNIKSTGFKIADYPDTLYLTDIPNKTADGKLDGSGKGIISLVKISTSSEYIVVIKSAGTINYTTGEIMLGTVNIVSTEKENNIIEVQAYPESNDVIGLKDLYLSLNVSSSKINMIKDTISSGEKVSGVGFKVTSSYANGNLIRN